MLPAPAPGPNHTGNTDGPPDLGAGIVTTPNPGPTGGSTTTTPGTVVSNPGTPPSGTGGPLAGDGTTVTPAENNGVGSILTLSQQASDFERSLVRLPPNERVAEVKTVLGDVAAANGWQKDSRLTRINGRDVYVAPDGALYAVDTQHGRFEKTDSRGKHLGEFNIDLNPIPNSRDKSGGHDLRTK